MYMYLMNHRLGRGAVWYKFTLLLLIRAVYFKLLSVAVDAHTFFIELYLIILFQLPMLIKKDLMVTFMLLVGVSAPSPGMRLFKFK